MKLKLLFVVFPVFFLFQLTFAQEVFMPYYVVIGGFKSEENAQKYCEYAQYEQNLPAVYAYNEERQLFYVYVRATQTKDIAEDILARVRSGTAFKDAWVFNGVLTGASPVVKKPASPPPAERPQPEPPVFTEQPVEPKKEPETKPSGGPTQTEATTPAEPSRPPAGRPFVFKLLDKETGEEIKGFVRIQDGERALQGRSFNGNEKVYITAPTNKTGKWVVMCQSLGFRLLRKAIPYDKAAEIDGATVGPEQEIVIPLELQRVKRGDYIEMENVKFYNNAALLTPGSERELDQLVALMQENSDYHVRLHGHTNGNEPRDIVALGTSTDLFNPNTSNAKLHVSAKELGLLRAETVKAYVVSKGINPSRISTKGEGGTQMIVDSRGTLAGLNDRVEVEIRKH